jgi:predicted membrane channel-forming protein YqfA (hemolysin III family)
LPARILRILIYILVAFFTLVYPLSGLLTDLGQQNAFNLLMQVGLILYITGLSLYVADRKPETV